MTLTPPSSSERTGPSVLTVLGLIFMFIGIGGFAVWCMFAGFEDGGVPDGALYFFLAGVVAMGACWGLDWLGEQSALKSAAADSTETS